MKMNFECISVERRGAVAWLFHNRPEARNAESRQLLDELDAALGEAVANDTVRVIVIAGKGEHFSAGHDLKEAQSSRSAFTVEQRYAYEETRYFDYALRIWDCPKPTIASVQGACMAGGFMVANMCDMMVASEDAFFSDPVCQSLASAAVEVLVHPWVMGLRAAHEFLLTGRRMSAQEAHRLGMVNHVVPRDQLDERTTELAEKVAGAYPFAAKLVKRSLKRAADIQGFRASLQSHFDTHQLSHVSDEYRRMREAGLAAGIARGKGASGT
ncbi:enoyl-CoA hydratase [Bosea sp. (in: a-proteobacteria)]|uniref:enoyl-CoA hydratase n=1 Tax=Bosea sp. (in: a-proteobacteria) TaxID=1871050 RepID=UPI002639AC8A|nr:enoyl-CoA hydratase [Bosea sp. (in: a-proteobacteria)]MCO5089549.1 enoyl-CoA hydratase [Bosea sp. (in: a-proteobacteria)]